MFANLLLTLSLLSAAPSPLTARSTRLWVSGTSNLHDWSCEAQAVKSRVELTQVDHGLLPSAVDVAIAVKALHCGNSKMDEKLEEALKAGAHPEIDFVLVRAKALDLAGKRVLAEGQLTIAGVTRKVAFLAEAAPGEDTLTVTGKVPVEMSDYGVDPPTAILGALKTGNQVVVHFELVFELAKRGAP